MAPPAEPSGLLRGRPPCGHPLKEPQMGVGGPAPDGGRATGHLPLADSGQAAAPRAVEGWTSVSSSLGGCLREGGGPQPSCLPAKGYPEQGRVHACAQKAPWWPCSKATCSRRGGSKGSTHFVVKGKMMLGVQGSLWKAGAESGRWPRSPQAGGAARELCREPVAAGDNSDLELQRPRGPATGHTGPGQQHSASSPTPSLPAQAGSTFTSSSETSARCPCTEFASSLSVPHKTRGGGAAGGLGFGTSPASHPGGQGSVSELQEEGVTSWGLHIASAHFRGSWLRDHPTSCATCDLTLLRGKGLAEVGVSPNRWVSPRSLCWAVRMSPFVTYAQGECQAGEGW